MQQKHLLSLLIGAAFGSSIVQNTGVGATNYHFDKEHVKSWTEEGKKAGAFVRDSFANAEKSVMQMLLDVAMVIAGTPSVEDFLNGYASAWANPDTAKSRKTDARSVIEAFGKKNADGTEYVHEKIVDWEKDEVGNLKKGPNNLPIPVKESKTAKEWLLQYEGDYKGFLSLAREIKNAGTSRASQGTAVPGTQQASAGAKASNRKKVTDKQFAAIMASVPVATAPQAHAMVVEATKQLRKMPQFEMILVNEMELLCNQLKTSDQPIFQNAAASILDVLNDLREEVRKAKEADEKMKRDAAANTAGAPIPQPASTPAPTQPTAQGDEQPAKEPQKEQQAA